MTSKKERFTNENTQVTKPKDSESRVNTDKVSQDRKAALDAFEEMQESDFESEWWGAE